MIFTPQERDTLYRVIHQRRDIRHFSGGTVATDVLARIITAGHAAPSVGLMQPWRFIRITDRTVRQQLAAVVEQERLRTAEQMDQQHDDFMRLKVAGMDACAELLAVVLAPDDGTVFGRRTMPEAMALCSAACAIENMWLAARAENLGLGWVSFFEPQAVASLLHCPPEAQVIALLCLGPVTAFYDRPMLEAEGWRERVALDQVLTENSYPQDETIAR
ncbi:MAG: 5,6-dimethylbenzimidazole synthase [Mariprofundaceae bacterium]|nr:5,6-dimethylbenzimidazole synthase [Mariprofundaceae bacterium]